MKKEKIYVLDYDIISPIGIGKKLLKKNLKNNFCAEKKISNFYTEGLELKVAAEISNDLKYLYKNESQKILNIAKLDRKFELTLAIYFLMKIRLEKIFELVKNERSGVILGVGADTTSFALFEKYLETNTNIDFNNYENIIFDVNFSDLEINNYFNSYDIHAIYLAEKLKITGFQKSILTACVSSTQAIGFATNSIINNEADIVLCGGTDSIINLLAFVSFDKLGALASQSKTLGETCKPFDIQRSGALASEAAGLTVLASESFVKINNLKPKFEIIGFGNTLDAYKITAPDPTGKGIKRAINEALFDANISKNDIDYINLHGTGTQLNDIAEAKAFNDVFGKSLLKIPHSSTKDRHGHAIASAGIQEFAVLCASMEQNIIPHTINLKNPIKNEYFKPVMHKNIEKEINIGMTCNYAFGGINSVLIIKKIK